MNPAPEAVSEPAPRRVSRTVLGILVGSGLLLLLVLVAWLAGWFGHKAGGSATAKPTSPPPAAELKLDLATPLDRAAAPPDLSLHDSLAAVLAGVDAKTNPLDDASRFTAKAVAWGDLRKAGDQDIAARNWELRFVKGVTKEKYARQLDFFHIELAVVMPDNKLVYVRNFSKAKPETHSGPADQEKRRYLTWRQGDLSRADADLLNRAGASPGDRVVLKILPPDVEATLAKLEQESAGGDASSVSKTQFGIRPAGDGFEFYVTEQYRKERAK